MGEETSDVAGDARAKAEARRRRILEASGERMGIVSGEQAKPVSEEQSGSSSRLQAMRRRRFKKKDDSSSSSTINTESQGTSASSAPAPAVTKAAEPSGADKKEQVDDKPKEEKKKYLGVAKMRRQMLRKEKQKAEAAASEPAAVAAEAPVVVKKMRTNKMPILIHFLAVLILFFVGYDIGSSQFVHPSAVRTEFSPLVHGIGLLNRMQSKSQDPGELLESQNEWDHVETDEWDEFEPEEVIKEPVIDPVFQVDLDELTKGDTLFFMIARFAVSVHRFNLLILYYLPLKIFNGLVKIQQRLASTPPVLFLVCVAVRQIANRLGAELPKEEPQKGKKDVVGMAKQGVMSMVSSNFPMLLALWNGFRDLRADMLVVLCGIFSSLVINQALAGLKSGFTGAGTDEL